MERDQGMRQAPTDKQCESSFTFVVTPSVASSLAVATSLAVESSLANNSLSGCSFSLHTGSLELGAQLELPQEHRTSSSVDSPDDVLAAQFPVVDRSLREVLRPHIVGLIEKIRPLMERSSGIGPEEDSIGVRDVSFRFGAERFCWERGPIVWIECRCLDSGAYLLPDLHEAMRGELQRGGEDIPPERFFDGYARLFATFDRETGALTSLTPWVSPECSLEAHNNFMRSLRGGLQMGASYLLSQYHDLVVLEAGREGHLHFHASLQEQEAYIEGLGGARITSVTTEDNGDTTYLLEYRGGGDGEGDLASQGQVVRHRVTIKDHPLWGPNAELVSSL